MQVAFDVFCFCVWDQMHWRRLRTVALLRDCLFPFLQWSNGLSESMERFFEKPFWLLQKNVLNFMIDKNGIIFLSSHSSKSFAPEVLSDSEVTILGEQKDTSISLCSAQHNRRSTSLNFFVFQISGVFHQGLQLFCVRYFFNTASDSFYRNWSNLMSN